MDLVQCQLTMQITEIAATTAPLHRLEIASMEEGIENMIKKYKINSFCFIYENQFYFVLHKLFKSNVIHIFLRQLWTFNKNLHLYRKFRPEIITLVFISRNSNLSILIRSGRLSHFRRQ